MSYPQQPQQPQPQPAAAPVTNVYVQSAPTATRGPNHVLHGLLTLFTGGLWLPVWIIVAMRNKRRPI